MATHDSHDNRLRSHNGVKPVAVATGLQQETQGRGKTEESYTMDSHPGQPVARTQPLQLAAPAQEQIQVSVQPVQPVCGPIFLSKKGPEQQPPTLRTILPHSEDSLRYN